MSDGLLIFTIRFCGPVFLIAWLSAVIYSLLLFVQFQLPHRILTCALIGITVTILYGFVGLSILSYRHWQANVAQLVLGDHVSYWMRSLMGM